MLFLSFSVWFEAWILKGSKTVLPEAFEMQPFRRILKASWIEHIRNYEVLSRNNMDRQLLLRSRKENLHVTTQTSYELVKLIMKDKIDGRLQTIMFIAKTGPGHDSNTGSS